jgi:soluble lytic murein transglycosylase
MLEADYGRGVEAWRRSLTLALPPRAASEAELQLALALTKQGQGSEALQLASQLQGDPRQAFIQGLALEASDRHPEAMATMASYAANNPAVAPAVYLEIAEREQAAGRAQEAADAASRGLDQAQARQLKQQLLEIRAQALATLGQNEAAFDAHRQVLALATSSATLGEQLFRLAEVSRELGKRDESVRALRTALDEFPSASTTADALRLVDELQAADEVDPFILGRARYFAVDYRNAVTAFDRYLQAEPDGPDATAARLYKALASLTPGNEPNALRELDAIADDPNQDSELAAQALVEGGQALEGLSESDQAEVRYQRLLERFPRLDASATAAFRLGLVRYVRGADSEAVAAWDGLIARRDDLTSDDVSRAFYWRAKALQRLGRDADARASLQQAAQLRPASYYSLRAAALLGDLEPGPDQSLAEWLASRNQDLGAANATVANDPALSRAQSLSALGLVREANWEADELLQRYPDRADRLTALAQRFRDLGLVNAATRLGDAAMTAASIDAPQDAPRALRELAYPRPFAELDDSIAGRYGLDPLLLDSTVREATRFDAWTDDAASGARGLARMSPLHAEEAARGLGNPNSDSIRPVRALEQHAWLLADRLRRFDSRPEVSLAALNTTERLVDGWLVRPGADDPDTFIEQIDYEGTRAVLHDVLGTRMTYGLTYGASLDPLAAINVKPEPTAGWIKVARLAGDVPPAAPVSPAAALGTPEQQQIFSSAATLQRDGDHAAAAGLLRGVASASDAAVASAARLRLGQALLGAARPAEALQALQTLEPSPDQAFLSARALAALGECQPAIEQYQHFVDAVGPPLSAQGLAGQAACQLDTGHADEAVALLEQATATSDLPRLQTIDLRERLALARLRGGDMAGARVDYAALLTSARSDTYRAELNYILGVVAPDSGTAATRFRAAVQLDSKSPAARAALDELVSLGDPFASSFDAAETRFAQDRYREALAAYTAFVQSNPADGRAPKAYYGRGVSLVRLNQDRAGIAVLESIAQRFPNTADAADGTFRGGRIRESLADLDGAAQSYRTAMAQPGAGTRATDAQFRLAFVFFRQGRFADAAASWRDLASRVSAAEDRAQALFWLGKVLRAQGDTAGASTAWTAARDTDPRGFYGMRADDLLAGRDDPRAASNVAVPEADATPDLRAFAASRGDVSAARARLDREPGLARAQELLALGLRREASWELSGVSDRLGSDVPSLALLGAWEQQHGLYNAALLLGYDISSAARTSLVSGPVAVRKLLYPLPHPAALQRSAERVHVDPLLFSALMLQESNMDQDGESAAQARGLSQLIASTAYDAARALGVYNFRSSDLFKPATSIELGAYTFQRRVARYDGRIFPALAAYNANQFSVDGWLLSSGDADVDSFAEAIPFTETYPYVQRIYANYRQYLELYRTRP